jgi:hypothetical protein
VDAKAQKKVGEKKCKKTYGTPALSRCGCEHDRFRWAREVLQNHTPATSWKRGIPVFIFYFILLFLFVSAKPYTSDVCLVLVYGVRLARAPYIYMYIYIYIERERERERERGYTINYTN